MRAIFTTPPAAIYWYAVEWDAASLSWADFRGKVLGATDPTAAPDGAIRKGTEMLNQLCCFLGTVEAGVLAPIRTDFVDVA